ncbi:MAG: tRNA uridine-5-carboxymethylaminomethyl(34) synthesis enzyme MnmG [Clostridia bacterium]|nr:tRNA uridine-5-carboxymethylaminomethyl(34) synthesis enzyme MnmG [Clostridia bacterium]
MNFSDNYDVAVVGAGHAGVEAALACARLGMKTVIFTINLDAVANMPCNPSIGGTAKGHLVHEIDALGGEMGKSADKIFLQSRMLNLGKGPAVHSSRIQADRREYQKLMKHILEKQDNLSLKQAEITDILTENGAVTGVKTHLGAIYNAKAVIVCTGTYLNGRIIVGEHSHSGGPDGMFAATKLTDSIRALGISTQRFKTGTPSRINRRSVDLTKLERQDGDKNIVPMSFENEGRAIGENTEPCWLVYTNDETKRIIKENLHRSPLYSGDIHGIGPRYCPSIEDKIVRFADKERHQLFLEPTGKDTEEMYLQGMSSSLPEDVQIKMIRSLEGFENAEIMRIGYAIEYDCADPLELTQTLEFKKVSGLYGAGQFNGTSGYEEAAAQGLFAGINAALKIKGEPPLILDRSSSYIGTLIDDLVTKGTREPYRMMTSRSEYRLLLRQDNADERLTPYGRRVGLISDERWERFETKMRLIAAEEDRVEKTFLSPNESLLSLLSQKGSSPVSSGISLADLIRRPELDYDSLAPVDKNRPSLPKYVCEEVEIRVKYAGYISRQKDQAEQFKKLEEKRLPPDFDYTSLSGLRLEARQKLNAVKPSNIGQAGRISGVSPADVAILLVHFKYI